MAQVFIPSLPAPLLRCRCMAALSAANVQMGPAKQRRVAPLRTRNGACMSLRTAWHSRAELAELRWNRAGGCCCRLQHHPEQHRGRAARRQPASNVWGGQRASRARAPCDVPPPTRTPRLCRTWLRRHPRPAPLRRLQIGALLQLGLQQRALARTSRRVSAHAGGVGGSSSGGAPQHLDLNPLPPLASTAVQSCCICSHAPLILC